MGHGHVNQEEFNMKIGPKYKIARRLGAPVFEKTQTQKFALRESRKAKQKRYRPRTDYGNQIIEKQKARYSYLVPEKQFAKYVSKASAVVNKKPAEALFEMLESRLDNVVLRLGLAPTRNAARQMVSHGHIIVNGKKVTIPSYQVKEGDEIKIRPQSMEKGVFMNLEERLNNFNQPAWLTFDSKKKVGKVVGEPKLESADLLFDINLVLEFYSR